MICVSRLRLVIASGRSDLLRRDVFPALFAQGVLTGGMTDMARFAERPEGCTEVATYKGVQWYAEG